VVDCGPGNDTITASTAIIVASISCETQITLDSTPPGTPTITGAPISTNDSTPIISGTYDDTEIGGTFTVTIDGATYTLGGLGVNDGYLTAVGNIWTLDLSALLPVLVDGTYPIVAEHEDASGNTATDVTNNELILDATDPVVPTVNALTTSDTTPIITGTYDDTETGDTFTVTIDGTTYTLGIDPELTNVGNTWTLDLSSLTPALIDGTYTVVAIHEDAFNNTATDATTNELEIDSTLPATPTVNTIATNDTTPIITGTFDSVEAGVI
jgi:hypothetical protein